RNALGAVRTLGGCVVSYDELHDAHAHRWADALAQVSGVDRRALLESRNALLHPQPGDEPGTCLSLEAARLWQEAESLRGAVFAPARPATRLRNVAGDSVAGGVEALRNLQDNPVCTVAFDAAVPCIAVVWKGYATSAQFRYVHEEILRLIQRHGVGKVL